MKRKRVILAALVMVLAFVLMPVNAGAASKKAKLDKTKVTMVKGDNQQLKLNNAPKGKKITWSSNKKSVATVSKKGKVTAKKAGKAKITAKVSGKKYTCTVTVKKIKAVKLKNTKGKNKSDVAVLQKILNRQNTLGAKLPKQIKDLNSLIYTWNEKGRLTKITWTGQKMFDPNTLIILKDSISFAGLTELTTLGCSYNQLSGLDVSKNKKLEYLNCDYNQKISSLNVSKNTKLEYLYCSGNQISSLDVSKNIKLKYMNCDFNQLSSLDVSKNANLRSLGCFYNKLTKLNVGNINLETLHCGDNQLSKLDVSKNTKLETLWCNNNQLSSLDVSKNTKLETLGCDWNQLSSLNVSKNTELESLYCTNNKISRLDLTNNKKMTNLSCDDTVELIGYDR